VTRAEAAVAAQAVPAAAAEVFGANIDRARRYADLLCTEGVISGLVGPREPARMWSRHLLNSAALAPYLPPGAAVVDLGSGAGLPGVPLVLARPDLRMTLLEPLARRMRFLEQVRAALGLDITLVRARAEDAAGGADPIRADVVVARAVAPLGRLLDLAVPLLRSGGMLLAHKGARAADELAAAADVLERLAPAEVSVHTVVVGDPDLSNPDLNNNETCVVRVVTNAERLRLNPSARGAERQGRGAR
jgi:16S rRNA (guanine527-N7)-methyltransferase